MPILPKHKYWIAPELLGDIASTLQSTVESSIDMAAVYKTMRPLMSSLVEIQGVDNIPSQGPIIAIKNHPFHLDSLILGELFVQRPDIHYVVKDTPLTRSLPEEHRISLRKEGPRAHPDDVKTLQTYLADGGSILSTPWGSLDHQAKSYATLERTVNNVIRYASFHNASVLPIYVDTVWSEDGQLPVQSTKVAIERPILPGLNGIDIEAITALVTDLYDTYAS